MAKIGEGHFSAMGRQGLRELRSAFYPSSNVASMTEYGMYGTKTQGEVAQDRRDDLIDPEDEGRSVLQEKLQQASDKMQGVSRQPEQERGMDR
jgi:hypothetical protein